MKRQLIKQQGTFSWIVIYPHTGDETLLTSLMNLRGEVLYNKGERPNFFNGIHVIADDDNLDVVSYHLLMFDLNKLVGGVRLTSIHSKVGNSVLLRLLNKDRYEKLLEFYANQNIIEASRLFITPEYRTKKNIINLYAGGFFVGSQVAKADIMLSANGVKRKHDQFVGMLLDGKPAAAFPEPIWVSSYNDAVRILCIKLTDFPFKIKKYLDSFNPTTLINIESQGDPNNFMELVA